MRRKIKNHYMAWICNHFFCSSFMVGLPEHNCQVPRRKFLIQICHPAEHPVSFLANDATLYGFIDVWNVWCSQIPKYFLVYLLFEISLSPKTEKTIMLGEYQFVFEEEIDVLANQSASDQTGAELPSCMISSPSFWKETCSHEESKTIQSPMFLKFARKTWKGESCNGKTRMGFSAVLRPQQLETSTSKYEISYRTVHVVPRSSLLVALCPELRTRPGFLMWIANQVWSQIVAG